MRVDGVAIAASLYDSLGEKLRGTTIGIVQSRGDAVTQSYVRIKERAANRLGVATAVREIGHVVTSQQVSEAIISLVRDGVDGVIVQLPLPAGVDMDTVLSSIPPHLDVDGLTQEAVVRPPVARAVMTILSRVNVVAAGKHVVVLGAGRLVGGPVARTLREAGALVTVIDKGDSLAPVCTADIVISGAGVPGLILPDMIRDGAVLIDAGTSELGGKVVGDIDPACAAKASVYTPVPGGVGPIAVAMIFENLLDLIEKKNSLA